MTRKQRRLTMIGGSLAVLAVAAALVLNAMRDSIVFFSTPSMAAEKQIPAGQRFRLGGLVQPGSLVRGDNLAVNFSVADGNATLPVAYKGILPDLFREGQGVVAEGALDACRRLPRRHRACQARRDLHAEGSRRRPEEAGPLEGRLRRQAPAGNQARAGSLEMIAEAGHYALVLALALALIQSIVPMIGARRGDVALMEMARSTALAQLLFVGASFGLLTACTSPRIFPSSTCSRTRIRASR